MTSHSPTVEDAIVLHGAAGSEAADAVAAFDALSPSDRQTLLTYVESL